MTEREKSMTLDELDIGQSGRITDVGGQGALRQHFLDMGLIPGADVTLVKFAPMGDPMELQIHGYELTLRLADAAQIGVIPIRSAKEQTEVQAETCADCEQPGLGEGEQRENYSS